MVAGSGDWDSMTDEQRMRYVRSERQWAAKSRTQKVLTYLGWSLLLIVVGLFANGVLDMLQLHP